MSFEATPSSIPAYSAVAAADTYMEKIQALRTHEPPVPPHIRERMERDTAHAIINLQRFVDGEGAASAETARLRPGQLPVFSNLLEALKAYGPDLRAYYSLPTGSGKSHLAPSILQLLDMRSIIATPRNTLARDIIAKSQQTRPPIRPEDIGIVNERFSEFDRRYTVTTNASYSSRTSTPDSPAEDVHGRFQPHRYGVVMLDEAHRALAPNTRATLRYYGHAIQLGLTATEKYGRNRHIREILPLAVHHISIEEARELDLISPWSNWVVKTGIDISAVAMTANGEYTRRSLQSELNTPHRNDLIARLYKNKCNGQQAFIFTAGVEHALDLSILMQRYGIRAAAAYGTMPPKEQEDVLERMKRGELDVVCNDQLFLEGTDVPRASVVINAAPVLSSLVRPKQRGGRALRKDLGNPDKRAIIVDVIDDDYRTAPILFSHSEIAGSAYHGTRPAGTVANEHVSYGADRIAVLITDPAAVEALAGDFEIHASKKTYRQYPTPPLHWATKVELAEETGTSPIRITSKYLPMARKKLGDTAFNVNKGRFRTPSGQAPVHVSPLLRKTIKGIREQEQQEQEARQIPADWLTARSIRVRYGIRPKTDELSAIAGPNPERSIEIADQGPAFMRYSPEVVEEYVSSHGLEYAPPGSLPSTWRPLACNVEGASEAYAFMLASLQLGGKLFKAFGDYMEADGITYVNRQLWDLLQKAGKKPPRWLDDAEAAQDLGVTVNELRAHLEKTQLQPQILYANRKVCVTDEGIEGCISPLLRDILAYDLAQKEA